MGLGLRDECTTWQGRDGMRSGKQAMVTQEDGRGGCNLMTEDNGMNKNTLPKENDFAGQVEKIAVQVEKLAVQVEKIRVVD